MFFGPRGAAVAAALAAGLMATMPAAASAAAPVTPTHTAVVRLVATANEYAVPMGKGSTGEHLHQDGHAVVVPDGRGGWITAIPVVRWPTADGLGGYVLFWHNRTFVGSSSPGTATNLGHEAVAVSIVRGGRNNIVLRYAVYKPSDAACCPSLPPVRIGYGWNGSHIVASSKVPAGALERNLAMRL
jgi:hypothetical protein